ncbi:ATP-binding protein [Pseudomonas asplenii]|uniref:ATP-binding protein n=1 Tax=Pseudomonas asplenii TaxID=53407 RepID=UPI0006B59428|nr:ATP-binding protein [Pseudomonas fuscovaginae]KPA98213.1 GAF containing transcriptional regulator [Pseudomonas fuscovaginae]
MAIEGYDKREFGRKLNEVVSPSRPILSVEHLIGREKELDRIEKALMAHGRNVFIFGERGVGKSSLAATAANQWQSSDNGYIDVSCAPDSTVKSIVANIASQAIKRAWVSSIKLTEEASVKFKWLSYSLKSESTPVDFSTKITNLGDAIDVLKEVALLHSDSPVVVVDEVDRMSSDSEIDMLADLLKQMGDKQVPLKFIFTGVGSTLNEILGFHRSAIRQLETIELPKLSWDARWDIAIAALKEFGVGISKDICVRIAAVSDGYPYYVHLIVEKLLWILFEKDEIVKDVKWEDYFSALDVAIQSISAELARPYELAINQRTQDYEEVLWSTSADEWQGAYMSSMHLRYQNIMKQMENKEPLKYDIYTARIRNLLKPEYGQILVKGTKQGYYHFREKMLRGYIRMQAEANRIEIISEEASANIKYYIRVPAKNVGYFKSEAPKGMR